MRCTGKEQLTCNEEKMGCEGCFYAKEEASIQEDIKVLEELKNKKYIVDKVEGWEQYLLTTRQQIAIENLIARNKELEENQCCMTVCMRKDKEKLFFENKVREKIEKAKEYEKDVKTIITVNGTYYIPSSAYYKILQKGYSELLQEGDK